MKTELRKLEEEVTELEIIDSDRSFKGCCAAIRTINIRSTPSCDCGFTRLSEFSAIGLLTRSKRSRGINLIWPGAARGKKC